MSDAPFSGGLCGGEPHHDLRVTTRPEDMDLPAQLGAVTPHDERGLLF
jgi:hypothetical protein